MIPTVGQTVHYMSHGSPVLEDGTQRYTPKCRAAIITDVNPATSSVALMVLNPTGIFFDLDVPYSVDNEGGTWHWPEQV